VTSAAFAFDPVGFAPTYHLIYGSPGRSLALEMANRLGLNRQIVDRARQALGTREQQLATQLERMDRDLARLAEDRKAVSAERAALVQARARAEQREEELREREAAFKRKLNDRVEERVRTATREIDAVVQALKRQSSALTTRDTGGPRLSTGDQGSLRAHARAAVEAVAARAVGESGQAAEAPKPAPIEARPARVGDAVLVPPFGLQGVVRTIADGQAEIDVHGKRLRAAARDLKVVGGTASAKAERPAQGVKVTVDLAPRPGLLSDLNVVGCTVDEALERTERFLDETLVTDQRTVRVIHGHGTGKLQKAISGFLKSHPLVDRFHTAPHEQGGGGVTVVELKE